MKNKILVCLYGQVRTLNYCIPYLEMAFKILAKKLDAELEFTSVLKTFNTSFNTTDYQNVDNTVDTKYVNIPTNTKLPVFISKEFENTTVKNHLHRSPYSAYLQTLTAVLKNIIELRTDYDIIFMVRSDTLVGSTVISLAQEELGCSKVLAGLKTSRQIYAHHGVFRMEKEFNKLGMGDFFYYGNSVSIKLLLSHLTSYIRSSHSDVYPRLANIGPNVLLYRSCAENEIQVLETNVDVTIVRQSSDQNQEVFTSFKSQKAHFLSSHNTLSK